MSHCCIFCGLDCCIKLELILISGTTVKPFFFLYVPVVDVCVIRLINLSDNDADKSPVHPSNQSTLVCNYSELWYSPADLPSSLTFTVISLPTLNKIPLICPTVFAFFSL